MLSNNSVLPSSINFSRVLYLLPRPLRFSLSIFSTFTDPVSSFFRSDIKTSFMHCGAFALQEKQSVIMLNSKQQFSEKMGREDFM